MLAIRIALPLSLITALACASSGAPIASDRPTDVPPIATPTPAPVVPEAPTEDAPEEPAPREPEHRSGVQNGIDGKLFGALVDEQSKRWQVVIVTYDPPEDPSAPPIDEEEGAAPIESLPAGHMWIPDGWAKGDVWTLVTPDGAKRHVVSGIGAWASVASGTLHTEVRLGKAKGKKGPAIAIRGDVVSAAPKLRRPIDVGVAALGPDGLGRITEAVAIGQQEPREAEELRKAPVVAKSVTVIGGEFPGGRTHAIVVRHDVSEDLRVNAILFAGEGGKIERLQLGESMVDIRPFAIGDLDADGFDDLVIEQDGIDDAHTLDLVRWSGGRPESRMLTGTGL